MRSTMVGGLLFATLILLAPLAVQAENWGQYNGWEVTSFQLTGLPDGLLTNPQTQLALHGHRKLLGRQRPAFKVSLLAEDLARIRLLLARNGYPKAQTHPVADPRRESRQLGLLIQITPGPAVLVGAIQLAGWPARVALPDTTRQGVIHQGQIFRDDDIGKITRFLRHRLRDSGFESATVKPALTLLDDDRADLHFQVEPGPYSVIDTVVVTGCSDDLKSLARRIMDIPQGQEYSADKVKQAALELRGTQLFSHIELNTDNIRPGHLGLQATLENARMRAWRAGVGTWTDNPWMFRVNWSHNNLFRNGLGFGAGGVFAEHEKSVGAKIFWLGWLTPRARTSLGFSTKQEQEDSFESREARLELVQAFRPNRRDIWKVGTSFSLVDVETFTPDPGEIPTAQGPMLEIWSDWKWDRTDSPLFPTQGHYLKVSATVAPAAGVSERPYAQLQFDGVKYQRLLSRVTLAGRIRAGGSRALGDTDALLANRRFHAGGYNTMRGYSRRNLGPKDQAGDPRGGQYVGLAGLEIRFPLFWILDGAAFFDAGQIWREVSDVGLTDLSGAVGLALDVRTPLGPLRLNYAVNVVNRLDDEPRNMWLFGIGYPW